MSGLRFGLNLSMSGRGAAHIIGGAVTPGSKSVQRVDEAGANLSGADYSLGGAYYASRSAFNLTETIIDGQYMVRVPKFWYRRAVIAGGANNGKEAWWVSDGPRLGFTVHPAFMSGGAEVPEFWIGKYQGSNDGGTKVASVPGAPPLASINIGTYRARCAARNTGGVTGFMMMSMYQLAAIQMLAMIEMGSTDSQATIGQGRVAESSAANVDAADVAQATYRGIVGLWGNVWQFLDGWRTSATGIDLWDRLGGKTWVGTGVGKSSSDGIGPLSMLATAGVGYDFRDVFVCDVKAGNEAASTWPDRIYQVNSTDRIAIHGGDWTNGASAGLWALYCQYASSSSSPYFGGRLAKV